MCGRIKNRDKAFGYEIVDFPFIRVQIGRGARGWNNRKVIADLFIIKYFFVFLVYPIRLQYFLCMRGQFALYCPEQILTGWGIILRESLGVRSWISDHLVSLVKRLGNLQCPAGRVGM